MSERVGQRNYQLHANANQHGRDWQLRVTLTTIGADGMEGEPFTWRGHSTMPDVDGEIDQAWVILCNMIHMLEAQGSCGRISSVLQLPLFDLPDEL